MFIRFIFQPPFVECDYFLWPGLFWPLPCLIPLRDPLRGKEDRFPQRLKLNYVHLYTYKLA